MSEVNNFSSNDRLEYGQIVLGHIKQILKLSMLDLGNPDICGRYETAVLTLSDALYSYYDDEMIKDYERFEKCRLDRKNDKTYGHYRNLFRALLGLTKRVDYFKSAVYGEDNEIIDDERGEE